MPDPITSHIAYNTYYIPCPFPFYYYIYQLSGGLAQLARASGWQPEGQGFDSPNLHGNNETVINERCDCLFFWI